MMSSHQSCFVIDILGFQTDGQLIDWIIVKTSQERINIVIELVIILVTISHFDMARVAQVHAAENGCTPVAGAILVLAQLGANGDRGHVAEAEANTRTNPVRSIVPERIAFISPDTGNFGIEAVAAVLDFSRNAERVPSTPQEPLPEASSKAIAADIGPLA